MRPAIMRVASRNATVTDEDGMVELRAGVSYVHSSHYLVRAYAHLFQAAPPERQARRECIRPTPRARAVHARDAPSPLEAKGSAAERAAEHRGAAAPADALVAGPEPACAPRGRVVDTPSRFAVQIARTALADMREATRAAGEVETGGLLFATERIATWRPVIDVVAASLPGPSARHERTRNAADPDHDAGVAEAMRRHRQLCEVGNWHVEPEATIPSPSDLQNWSGMRQVCRTDTYLAPIVCQRTSRIAAWTLRPSLADTHDVCQPARVL